MIRQHEAACEQQRSEENLLSRRAWDLKELLQFTVNALVCGHLHVVTNCFLTFMNYLTEPGNT